MDPLSWFQSNINMPSWMKGPKGAPVTPKGGAIVPTSGGGLSASPPIQSIRTNLNVPTPRGGGLGTAYTVSELLKPVTNAAATAAVDGAAMLAGRTPKQRQEAVNLAAGAPVVRNLDGVSYNVGSPEGRAAFEKARDAGGQTSNPYRSSTGPREVGDAYTVSGVTYDGTTHQALNPETGAISETGYSIQPSTGKRTDTVRQGRNEEAPDGSGAKGTQMGYKMGFEDLNSLVTRQTGSGMADINSFMSEALPVTEAGDQQGRPLKAGSVAPGEAVVEGISDPSGVTTSSVETADNNRAISIPGEMDVRALRRQAFLNPELNSMQALRAADAAIGLQSQGGKYFVNDGEELLEISKEDANKYRGGNLSAADLMGTYKEGIKETLVPVAQPDITEQFDTDTPVAKAVASVSAGQPDTSGINMSTGQAIEFQMNNSAPIGEDHRGKMKDNYFSKK